MRYFNPERLKHSSWFVLCNDPFSATFLIWRLIRRWLEWIGKDVKGKEASVWGNPRKPTVRLANPFGRDSTPGSPEYEVGVADHPAATFGRILTSRPYFRIPARHCGRGMVADVSCNGVTNDAPPLTPKASIRYYIRDTHFVSHRHWVIVFKEMLLPKIHCTHFISSNPNLCSSHSSRQ